METVRADLQVDQLTLAKSREAIAAQSVFFKLKLRNRSRFESLRIVVKVWSDDKAYNAV